jgi:molybdate transport system substrate-binding protein
LAFLEGKGMNTQSKATRLRHGVRSAGSGRIKILSTLAVQGAWPSLVQGYEESESIKVDVQFAPTNALLARIAAGEAADVTILTRAAIDELAAQRVVAADSVTNVAVSLVGIAVKAGAVRPDISSVDALTRALLGARSIAYSKIGASGVFFAALLERLGIAEAVKAKATVIPSGFTAELAARGDVELAVQQVSELMVVPGIDVVGPLPPGAESVTMFAAGVLARSEHPAQARQLLAYLCSPDAAPALAAAGLQPVA